MDDKLVSLIKLLSSFPGIKLETDNIHPRTLYFDKLGRKLTLAGDDSVLNPEWLWDKHKPSLLPKDVIFKTRPETSAEVLQRVLESAVRDLKNHNKDNEKFQWTGF